MPSSLPVWGGTHGWSTEVLSDTLLNRIETNTLHLKEHLDIPQQLVDTANAGQGALVVATGTGIVAQTTTQGQQGPIGVTLAPMVSSGVVEYVRWGGIAEVMIATAVAQGDPVRASATQGLCESCSAGDAGVFGAALTGAGTTGDLILVMLGATGLGGASTVRPLYDPHGLAVVPVLTDFTLTQHVGGSDTVTQEADRIVIHLAGSVADDERGIFLALPTIPFTADACIIPYVPPEYQFSLVLLENGSDKRSMERVYWDSTAGLWKIQDYKYTDYNSASSGGGATPYGGPTQALWLQVSMGVVASTRRFSYGFNGLDWRTKNDDTYTAAGFLPSNPTHLGITINTNTISEPGEIHIVHWHVH